MPIKNTAQIRNSHVTNTLFLLVGKSGSGKDTIADLLLRLFGIKKVKSVATRNPRYEGEDTYYFVSDEEYDAVLSWMYLNGLEGFVQEKASASAGFIPDF